MITPQPQPAAYWIALLEELTGMQFKIYTPIKKSKSLYEFMCYNWNYRDLLHETDNGYYDYVNMMFCEAAALCSGKSVIDAAVEFNDRNTPTDAFDYIQLRDNLNEQVQLYKRCNGIKD